MSLTADQKIGKSLEDLIKDRKAAQPKKKPASTKKITSAKPASTTGRVAGRRTRRRGGVRVGAVAAAAVTKPTKAAKSAGAATAKRSAAVNQRRGLNNSGVATKMDIAKAVATANRKTNAAGPKKRGGRGAAAAAPLVSGMKISFNPKDLNKTTEKAVAEQIKAVLSKQKGSGGGSGSNNGRSVISAASGSSNVSSSSGGNNGRRNNQRRGGGPKVRPSSGLVRLNR